MDNRGCYIHGYNLNVNKIRQDRHIHGSPNYIKGRSILNADAEMLVNLYAGRGTPIIVNGVWNNKERFVHTDVIGVWKSHDGKNSLVTNRGVFHYSLEKGVHIVPAEPKNLIR